MPSFSIYTLGCKLNQLESEALADAFLREGFSRRPFSPEDRPAGDAAEEQPSDSAAPAAGGEVSPGGVPPVLIINTCTVTSKADQKARRVIRKALRDYPGASVIVTGCYARLDPEDIAALEDGPRGADGSSRPRKGRLFVFPEKDALLELPRRLREAGGGGGLGASFNSPGRDPAASPAVPSEGGAAGKNAFAFAPEYFSAHSRSFLKIQDGCDNHCTYCRVRLARGKSVSLPAEKALAELRALEGKGYRETVLTGVNITQYRDGSLESGSRAGGPCRSGDLAGLLEFLLAGTQGIALRLSSLEPEEINDSLARVLARPRIRPHFHLSVQSGSARILEKMGRSYTPAGVEKIAAAFRSVREDPFLACDIITGFPGESDEEFEKTLNLCRNIGFAWIHAFPYSKRPGAPAFPRRELVNGREAVHRVEILLKLARQGRSAYIKRWLGRDVEALVEAEKEPPEGVLNPPENKKKPGYCRGVSDNYLKLRIKCSESPPPGTALRCRIVKEASLLAGDGYDAEAELVV
ncbi:MAG: radical SAM protein [Treponema sp.]|jgi:threonylcarbamoyladenosine tRNA methylthiotransferase MtaB|nr:radical SAM protein [Treponema sp.]